MNVCKRKLIKLKREIGKPIVITGDLNTPVSKIVKTKCRGKEINQWGRACTALRSTYIPLQAPTEDALTHCYSSRSRESDASGL